MNFYSFQFTFILLQWVPLYSWNYFITLKWFSHWHTHFYARDLTFESSSTSFLFRHFVGEVTTQGTFKLFETFFSRKISLFFLFKYFLSAAWNQILADKNSWSINDFHASKIWKQRRWPSFTPVLWGVKMRKIKIHLTPTLSGLDINCAVGLAIARQY